MSGRSLTGYTTQRRGRICSWGQSTFFLSRYICASLFRSVILDLLGRLQNRRNFMSIHGDTMQSLKKIYARKHITHKQKYLTWIGAFYTSIGMLARKNHTLGEAASLLRARKESVSPRVFLLAQVITSRPAETIHLACIAHKSLEICERCRLWQQNSPAAPKILLLFEEKSFKHFVSIRLFKTCPAPYPFAAWRCTKLESARIWCWAF